MHTSPRVHTDRLEAVTDQRELLGHTMPPFRILVGPSRTEDRDRDGDLARRESDLQRCDVLCVHGAPENAEPGRAKGSGDDTAKTMADAAVRRASARAPGAHNVGCARNAARMPTSSRGRTAPPKLRRNGGGADWREGALAAAAESLSLTSKGLMAPVFRTTSSRPVLTTDASLLCFSHARRSRWHCGGGRREVGP